MPAHLRAQAEALHLTTIDNYWDFPAPTVAPATLTAVGAAIRDQHLLDIDLDLSGYLLFFVYTDRPGVVGTVGAALGEAAVNIAGAQVSRTHLDPTPRSSSS